MPHDKDPLASSIKRMNLIEKEELRVLGQNVDENGQIELDKPQNKRNKPKEKFTSHQENVISRKDFLFLLTKSALVGYAVYSGLTDIVPTQAQYDNRAENKELKSQSVVQVERTYTELFFSSIQEKTKPFVDRVNELWQLFSIQHEVVSPPILEGFYTKFGSSAVSRGQLNLSDLALKQKLARQEILPNDLNDNQKRILQLFTAYWELNLENTLPIDSYEFKIAFANFIRSQGYVGVVAMKSPDDMGREGYVQVWNKLQEKWSQPQRVICLNTATYQTWFGFLKKTQRLEDFNDEYNNSTMRWVIELSDEVIEATATAYETSTNTSGIVRFIEQDAFEQYHIEFPQYQKETHRLHPSVYDLARNISNILARINIQDLESLTQDIPDFFSYMMRDTLRNANTYDNFVAFVLSSISKQTQSELPFFYGSDKASLIKALTTDSTEAETKNGLPIGNYLLHEFFLKLSQGLILNRSVICETDESITLQTGVLFVEDYSSGNLNTLCQGFLIKNGEAMDVIYVDKEGNKVKSDFESFKAKYTNDREMKRITVFSSPLEVQMTEAPQSNESLGTSIRVRH